MKLPPKVTSRAFDRLAEIGAAADGKALRVAVEGGGCSGFQYDIALDAPKEDDLILEGCGQQVVVDSISLPFLANATIDFSEELIGARFIIENPTATSLRLRHFVLNVSACDLSFCPINSRRRLASCINEAISFVCGA